MANNYQQFSEVLANLTEAEETWLSGQLQYICIFGEKEYAEDALPAGLDVKDADWFGVRFMRDRSDDQLSFDYCFGENEVWGRHIWLYAEDYGDVDSAAWLVHKFLKEFRLQDCWTLTYATYCSKSRVGEFSGGAVFVTANEINWQDASDYINQQRTAFEKN